MSTRPLISLIVLTLIIVATPAAALWETHQGSDTRPNHCQPVPVSFWRPPGLEWVLTKQGDDPNRPIGQWVITARGTNWSTGAERLLVTVTSYDGELHLHNETFAMKSSSNLGDIWPFVELMDVDRSGSPHLVVPTRGPASFGLDGKLIRTYEAEPIGPGFNTARTRIWPALGDFTGDGGNELVFSGDWEWHAFRADGEMIARHTVVDERNSAMWTDIRSHSENGSDYVYMLTENDAYGPDTDVYSRLHKLTLKPNPAATLAGPVPANLAPDDQGRPVLPYRFEHVWMKEFHTGAYSDGIRFYDLTGDGQEEVIISHTWWPTSETGGFSILDLAGNLLYDHGESVTGSVAIGDMNGDSVDEVVVLMNQFVYDDDERIWNAPSYLAGVQWNGLEFKEIYRFEADEEYGGRFLALCDVNGDGADEVLVALGESHRVQDERGIYVGEGVVKLLDSRGAVLWDYRLFFGHPWYGVIIDDFTGDGAYEFIIPSNAGQTLVFSPSQEPSIGDYERVFEGLLDRNVSKPTEKQVEGWLEEVEGGNSTAHSDKGSESEEQMVPSSLVVPGLVAILAVFRLRGRRESP